MKKDKPFFSPAKLIVSFMLLCSVTYSPFSVQANEKEVYIAVQSFTWREFIDGAQFVKESGPLVGVGFTYFGINEDVAVKPAVELFGGHVDYNGYACNSTGCEAATSTVNHIGLKLEGDVGRIVKFNRDSFIEPFAGLGFRFWRRDIRDGTTASGAPTVGYVENWLSLYGRAGIRANAPVGGREQIFGEAGIKVPFFNQNTAYVSSIGQGPDVSLRPGIRASYFAEVGARIDRFKASLFYDTFRFPQSPDVDNGVITAFQPESWMDIYGLRLGWTF